LCLIYIIFFISLVITLYILELFIKLYYGLGVAQDYAEALRWYQLAAVQGDHVASYHVAICHEEGKGVLKNKDEAIRWHRRSLAAGNALAENALQRLCAE